ncbi:DNA (cytosine-5-)-methyltransferase [Antarctobacter sp.]|uniref:DNA cytosine methyltransferase n=1 Tax=Antarctobacter sp. TaxID=1872577 RepID=UPI002B274859|nr:DNA (cytosine-5-)-methyltransferase [Antarctobacter sp.]
MSYTHIRWDISEDRRTEYAISSKTSQLARKTADAVAAKAEAVELSPRYAPEADMKQLKRLSVKTLSLFSGGGGLDLGFDRAGFTHYASYEILKFAGETLRSNRPKWKVFSGENGDVTRQDWKSLLGTVDMVHGGPPCQPFSIAGRRMGKNDARDMFPEFVRCVDEIRPKAFMAENVPGFLSAKFSAYRKGLFTELAKYYEITTFVVSSDEFGVPQARKRAICIGVRRDLGKKFDHVTIRKASDKRGVQSALGLSLTSKDGPAPTLRSTLTGPRQTTSIANSTASVVRWKEYGIWPHGISPNATVARSFPTKDGTYRMCVEECQIIQGFPLSWEFYGAVYQRLGMIGNSVCPPVAYALAKALRDQVFND